MSVSIMAFHFLQDTVNAICDDADIRAVSFVGSNTVSNSLLYINYFCQFFISIAAVLSFIHMLKCPNFWLKFVHR